MQACWFWMVSIKIGQNGTPNIVSAARFKSTIAFKLGKFIFRNIIADSYNACRCILINPIAHRCHPLVELFQFPASIPACLYCSPYKSASHKKIPPCGRIFYFLARRTGLEPATPGVTGRYSNQLSYHRACFMPRHKTKNWWVMTESNRRHPACKAGALPTELITPRLLRRVFNHKPPW